MKTKLFPIPLCGEGTADVESFSSYLHRVSFDHGVHVGELVRFAYHHGIGYLNNKEKYPGLPKYIKTEDVVRPNESTKLLIDLFELMTGQRLQSSVLWFLDGNIGRSINEVISGFRWCPECFKEMEQLEQEPYFKLIWHLTGVDACYTHRTALVSKCQACGARQDGYIKKCNLGACQKCGNSLSYRKSKLTSKDIINSWELIGADLFVLLSDISQYSPDNFNFRGARNSIEYLHSRYSSELRKGGVYKIFSEKQVSAIVHRKRSMNLEIIRRICFILGMSLFDFIGGNSRKTTRRLSYDWVDEIEPDFMRPKKKMQRDHREVYRKLLKTIAEMDRPPSLRKLSQINGVSVGYIDYRYPMLAQKIVEKHKEYHELIMLKKHYKAQVAAMNYFGSIKYDEFHKSRKQAYKVLREETGLPKFILKKAIQRAYVIL